MIQSTFCAKVNKIHGEIVMRKWNKQTDTVSHNTNKDKNYSKYLFLLLFTNSELWSQLQMSRCCERCI